MKVNGMNAAAMYTEDVKDAMEYVPSDVMFHLRSGSRIRKYYPVTRHDDLLLMEERLYRRSNAHNGKAVPCKYKTKAKNKEHDRDSIRRLKLNERRIRLQGDVLSSEGVICDFVPVKGGREWVRVNM